VTRNRAHDPKQPRFRSEAERLHDYVLYAANTGLRPDEAMRLQFRDVTVVEDEGSGQTILEIEVRGKRGVGYCKSTTGAVRPFERRKTRTRPEGGPGRSGSRTASMANGEWHEPGPTELLFPKGSRDLFNAILEEEKLRTDRDGRPRTAYSLRHTNICLRLLEAADIYQIAKNCQTSVEMIEKYYAANLKTRFDVLLSTS
jgi:integrase